MQFSLTLIYNIHFSSCCLLGKLLGTHNVAELSHILHAFHHKIRDVLSKHTACSQHKEPCWSNRSVSLLSAVYSQGFYCVCISSCLLCRASLVI